MVGKSVAVGVGVTVFVGFIGGATVFVAEGVAVSVTTVNRGVQLANKDITKTSTNNFVLIMFHLPIVLFRGGQILSIHTKIILPSTLGWPKDGLKSSP